jgi:beta-lactam-binding protein with PASTA domain/tRNA A-37 threonylcarbamoyl transferase component Bud32
MTDVADNTLVDGRYRILGRIGAGGMADVYRAEDTHLGREVALKVLHSRYAQDAEFVERFRREASSAAGLSHPNVVGVYDRGQHDGTYYIAMECLRGRTLKEIIEREAPLPQERAIDLGVQVLHAAGFAHRHGVIHRDFKPHNVIVDDDWNAKVTDFGIARYGTSEITETGSIMGTAHYLSPEQAQGQAVTAASDLYSIGVVLYEMLAGRLPFVGESAVAIALKHLSEPPPPLRRLRPDIDPGLESVVMAALAKDPAKRWQSADDMAAALESVRAHLAAPTGEKTTAFTPVVLPPGAEGAAAPALAAGVAAAEAAPAAAPDSNGQQAASADGAPPGTAPTAAPRRRRWPLFGLAVLVLALAGLLAYLAVSGLTRPAQVAVPTVEGKQLLDAHRLLDRAGLQPRDVRVRSKAPFDEVVKQDPAAGKDVDKSSTVTLFVSNGPGEVRVPSVKGLPKETAVKELGKASLKVNLDSRPSDSVRVGFAIGTVPKEGADVERGTRVRLFVSSGPQRVSVPDVIGLDRTSAVNQLDSKGFAVSVAQQNSDQPLDQVLSQDPAAGTRLPRGARITITVSKGPQEISVPDVVGRDAAAAERALRAAGLSVATQQRAVTSADQDGKVLDQHPGGGATAPKGATVELVVGRLKPQKAEKPKPKTNTNTNTTTTTTPAPAAPTTPTTGSPPG